MNNFVFGSTDPLLYNTTLSRQEYISEPEIKRQLDSVMQQYQQMQQAKQAEAPPQKDWLGDFDKMLKTLEPDIAELVASDQEFIQLNALVQQDIQTELMSNIRWKINSKQDSVQRIKRMIDIIETYNRDKAIENKKNIADITDYIQNYSDMTFNEYKKMKESSSK